MWQSMPQHLPRQLIDAVMPYSVSTMTAPCQTSQSNKRGSNISPWHTP